MIDMQDIPNWELQAFKKNHTFQITYLQISMFESTFSDISKEFWMLPSIIVLYIMLVHFRILKNSMWLRCIHAGNLSLRRIIIRRTSSLKKRMHYPQKSWFWISCWNNSMCFVCNYRFLFLVIAMDLTCFDIWSELEATKLTIWLVF